MSEQLAKRLIMKPSKGYNPETIPATCHPLFSPLPVYPVSCFPQRFPCNLQLTLVEVHMGRQLYQGL